jgi:hypothetical protein
MEKPKDYWIAIRKKIDEKDSEKVDEADFEETRRCLLNLYHSYVQTHAGYLIALVIGLVTFIPTVIFTFDTLLKSLGGTTVFSILIIGIILMFGLLVLNVVRVYYWTIYANNVTFIPIDKAIKYFNERKITIPINKRLEDFPELYSYKMPNTNIIQIAIGVQIRNDFKNNASPWYNKLALWLIQKVWKELL